MTRTTKRNNEVNTKVWRSKRETLAKDYGSNYVTYCEEEDPTNLQEVLSSLYVDLWQEVINNVVDSLEPNRTLVDLPPGSNQSVINRFWERN